MSIVYGIANQDGHPITDGIGSEAEARRIAQELADDRGESVWVCAHDTEVEDVWPDGDEISPAT